MTTLREAAQQALKFLEDGNFVYPTELADNLKAALAEHYCDTHCTWADHAPECPLAEPVQEPVAWEQFHEHMGGPFYTAPPQRKPLTEGEISNIWDGHVVPVFGKNGINPIVFARAIERAHGIGGNT